MWYDCHIAMIGKTAINNRQTYLIKPSGLDFYLKNLEIQK